MIKIGKWFASFLGLIFLTQVAWAQDITTTLMDNNIAEGDVFSIVVSVESSGNEKKQVDVPSKSRPNNEHISFLRQSKSESFSTTIVNGQVSANRKTQVVLTYHAKKQGRVKIPSILVTVDGKAHRAPGLNFVIQEPGLAKKKRGSGQRNSPFDSMESLFSKFFNQRLDNLGKGMLSNDVDFFIDVEVSNMTPFFGEQFVVRWYLYTNGRITDIDTLKYPALEGFWKEEISLAVTLRGEPVTRDGQNYTRYMLASYAVTPIVEDKAIVDTYEVKSTVAGYGSFFGNVATKEAIRKSDEAYLNIKPLPTPAPEDFSDVVGQFSLVGYTDQKKVQIGQPFTYNFKVSGAGQVKFMPDPELDFGENFQVYDVQESSKFIPPDKTEKTYSYLLIPKNLQARTIPSYHLSFFDPVKEEYYRLETQVQTLDVIEGVADTGEVISVYDIEQEGEVKKFSPSFYSQIKPGVQKRNLGSLLFYSGFYAFAFLVLILMIFAHYWMTQTRYSFEKDLNTRFEKLFELIDAGHWREASAEAVNIVYFYANSRSRKISRSQKLEDILTALPSSLRRKVEASLADLNQDLQKFSFAPESLVVKGDEKAKVKEKCLALKQLFERSLKNEDSSS